MARHGRLNVDMGRNLLHLAEAPISVADSNSLGLGLGVSDGHEVCFSGTGRQLGVPRTTNDNLLYSLIRQFDLLQPARLR